MIENYLRSRYRQLSSERQINFTMKTIWWAILASVILASCATQRVNSQSTATSQSDKALLSQNDELTALLPPGARLLLSARGDVDADGDDDVLVAYAKSTTIDDTPRALLILLRDANGVLHKSVDSPIAILCKKCGGMMGDPLQQMRVGRGEFTLRFEGGSRELWSSEFKFVFNIHRGVWILDEIVFNSLDRVGGKTITNKRRPADFGDITLEEFDAGYFSDDDPS
ncbi:MAG: hypothetical protein ABI644_04350 [Arenimonas sp.]